MLIKSALFTSLLAATTLCIPAPKSQELQVSSNATHHQKDVLIKPTPTVQLGALTEEHVSLVRRELKVQGDMERGYAYDELEVRDLRSNEAEMVKRMGKDWECYTDDGETWKCALPMPIKWSGYRIRPADYEETVEVIELVNSMRKAGIMAGEPIPTPTLHLLPVTAT
jgi:hypothetical protein